MKLKEDQGVYHLIVGLQFLILSNQVPNFFCHFLGYANVIAAIVFLTIGLFKD